MAEQIEENQPITSPPELVTNGGTHGTTVVRVAFTCERELHDRKDFQVRQGRILPSMHDERGDVRPWRGNQLHTLTLRWNGHQVLHVKADSLKVAERIMSANIEGSFWALWIATQTQKSTSAELSQMRINEGELLETIRNTYGKRFEPQFGTDAIAIARHIIAEGAK
jgi:hypothetical protein